MAKVYSPTMTLAQSLNVTSNKPLDTRTVVAQYSDLTNAATTFGGYEYEGMLVYVQSEQRFYVLSSIDPVSGYIWMPISLPEITSTDKFKILKTKLSNGIWTASWEDEKTELPSQTNKSGYFLRVNENGNGVEWFELDIEHPRELPETIGDIGQVLKVGTDSDNNKIVKWEDETQELPTIGPGSAGKVLTVSSNGVDTEWSTVDTSFMKSVTTEDLFSFATQGLLKPGMKYRITDYNPIIDANYVRKINGGISNIASSEVKFDIIVTASSKSTLFDDVELVSKDAGPGATFDYTKYEAKYDLVGNRDGLKYGYLQSSAAGVIYYMKDQFGNEASYDFENIVYVGIMHGAIVHTFSGVKNGDLRASGLIQNVRIKHNPSDLPGVLFITTSRYGRMFINDVELDNCNGVYLEDANLRHVKISNSTGINFIMTTTGEQQFCPLFENLNICNNETLTINCSSEFNGAFEELNGLHINNLNILPSFTPKTINVAVLLGQTSEIVVQGLYDSNVVKKLGINPETGGWTLALLEQNENAYRLIFGRSESARINLAGVKWDLFIYDSILNASKNIKPFDIFNPSNGDGSIKDYSLEIPQFQSTATSVVELGI